MLMRCGRLATNIPQLNNIACLIRVQLARPPTMRATLLLSLASHLQTGQQLSQKISPTPTTMPSSSSSSSVSSFYSDSVVFLTGSCGFLGKAILEKILRSCPAVREVCVLVRGKGASTTPQDRVNHILLHSPVRSHSAPVIIICD